MEQSPRLAQAMADGLGVTRGELRAMAMDGKLTSEVVINAVRSQGEAIASEFTTLPETVGNAVQTMKNSLFVFIGGMNESVNQSGRLAEAINYISSAFDNIDPTTMATIEKTFDSILDTAGVLFTTIKDLYTALSDIGGAFGVFVKGGEQVGFLTSVMQSLNFSLGVVSDGLKGISILADSMFGSILILAGGVVSTIEKMKGQSSDLSDELFRQATELHERADAKVMEFESSTKSAWAEMSKTAKDRLNETLADTEKTYDEMVAKGGYSAEAMQEQYIKVAMAKIAANDQMINDDLRLGLAAQDLQASISETGEVIIESSKGAQAAYDGLGQSFAEVALKAVETGKTMQEALTDAVPKAQTIGAVDDIISSLSALGSQGKISGEDMAFGINLANERYKEIESNFARYAAKSIKDNNGIVTSELEKAAALQGLAVQATETGGVLVTQLDRSTIASTRTKEQIDELASSVGVGLSKEFVKSSEGLKELINGFDDLTDAGYDAGEALVGSLTQMTNKASNTAEIEYVIEQWKELGKEGKITGQELAEGLEGVKNRADILKEGINGVTEAYGFLGIKTREELAKDAKAYTDSYKLVMAEGKLTAQQQEEVFTKMAKANAAANDGVIDSFTRAQAAAKGFTVEIDANGRTVVARVGEVANATAQAAQAITSHAQSLDNNTASTARNGGAIRANTAERKQQSTSTWNAKFATDAANESESAGVAILKRLTNGILGKIDALRGMGDEVVKTTDVYDKLFTSVNGFGSSGRTSWDHVYQIFRRMNKTLDEQTQSFKNAKEGADAMTSALGGASVNSKMLSDAQFALRKATDANIQGLVRMDSQTLDKLKSAIDSARQRMKGLADDAKNTADSLEAALAKMQGNEDKARDIEQTRKLTELQEKLNEAKARGNSEEAAQLNRALELQKQINREEDKKARADKATSNTAQSKNTQPRSNKNDDSSIDNNQAKFDRTMGGANVQYAQPQPVLPQSALDAIANLSKTPNFDASKGGATKTIDVNFKLGGASASLTMPENQEGALMALLQQLQDSKAIAGY